MVFWQLSLTYNEREYHGELSHPKLAKQILSACIYTSNAPFYLAHWIFAYSYLTLSIRLELLSKKMPTNTYKRRLITANVLVCLFNVTVPAGFWVVDDKENLKGARIITDVA